TACRKPAAMEWRAWRLGKVGEPGFHDLAQSSGRTQDTRHGRRMAGADRGISNISAAPLGDLAGWHSDRWLYRKEIPGACGRLSCLSCRLDRQPPHPLDCIMLTQDEL